MDLEPFFASEVEVDDRGRIGLAIGLGAVIGGAVGYLLFTDRGRDLRRDLEPRLQDLLAEIDQLTRTFERARAAAVEGWQSFSKLTENQARGAADAVKTVVGDPVTGVPTGRTH
jgi:gas vesicle protein